MNDRNGSRWVVAKSDTSPKEQLVNMINETVLHDLENVWLINGQSS